MTTSTTHRYDRVLSDFSHRPPRGRPDDFVYHLYRGSALLLRDDVGSAKRELERALRLQPEDAKGQDLLASTYFRLGLYPRAIELWSGLVAAHPESTTLRVNLSLVLIKTGQVADAAKQLEVALAQEPAHERAWKYLGLAKWRLGRLDEARDAFARAGEEKMAERMEAAINAKLRPSRMPPPIADDEPDFADNRAAMRSAAEEALERIESEHPHLALAPSGRARRGSGTWNSIEPGREATPRLSAASSGVPRPVEGLAERIAQWRVPMSDGEFALSPAGSLVVSIHTGDLFCRLDGLSAVRGELETTIVPRTERGRSQGILGDRRPVMRWRAPVGAVLKPIDDQRFELVTLGKSDTLFLRERFLFGCSGSARLDSLTLNLGDSDGRVIQVSGPASVALCVPGELCSVPVDAAGVVYADPAALVGWTGRLFPRAKRGTAPYSVLAPELAFKGEGSLILQA